MRERERKKTCSYYIEEKYFMIKRNSMKINSIEKEKLCKLTLKKKWSQNLRSVLSDRYIDIAFAALLLLWLLLVFSGLSTQIYNSFEQKMKTEEKQWSYLAEKKMFIECNWFFSICLWNWKTIYALYKYWPIYSK